MKIAKLFANNGKLFDEIKFTGKKNLPEVIITGLNQYQHVFLREKSNTYKEVSWCWYLGEFLGL